MLPESQPPIPSPGDPGEPDRREQPPRFRCLTCKDWPGTNAPQKWGEHVNHLHGGINPNNWNPLRSRKRERDRAGVKLKPADRASIYAATIKDLELKRSEIDQAIRTLRKVAGKQLP